MQTQGESQNRRGPISSVVIVCLLLASVAIFAIHPAPEWWARESGSFRLNPVGFASLAILSTAGLVGLLTTPRGRPPMFALTRGRWLLVPWANVVAFSAVLFDRDLFDVVMPGGNPAGDLVSVWFFLAFMFVTSMMICTVLGMSTWALVAALRLLGIYEPVARSWASLNRR